MKEGGLSPERTKTVKQKRKTNTGERGKPKESNPAWTCFNLKGVMGLASRSGGFCRRNVASVKGK